MFLSPIRFWSWEEGFILHLNIYIFPAPSKHLTNVRYSQREQMLNEIDAKVCDWGKIVMYMFLGTVQSIGGNNHSKM